jgi:tetratricopeptide (TPR) repeat protein
VAELRRRAEATGSADAWRELGDALAIWHREDQLDSAIDAYARAVRIRPDDGDAHFRLGVCYRMRYESGQRQRGDFQAAVDEWSKALATDPNQYIWRRRIQQYGPRLDKPYPFYEWVSTATREIEARGETPARLRAQPTGSEIAQPARRFESDAEDLTSPDPKNRVFRDMQGLVRIEVVVVPPRIKPGEPARVHVTLRPDDQRKVHWNNEGEPLKLWMDLPPGWQAQRRLLEAPQGDKPETTETRHLEFEVRAAADAAGRTELSAYALYYVCEDVGETCRFLRQDIPIIVQVGQ